MEILLGDDVMQWEQSFREIIPRTKPQGQGKAHPRMAALVEEGKAWAEVRIAPVLCEAAMQKLRGDNCGGLACYMWPNAEPARAMTLVKFCYWIILFDDVADDPRLMGCDVERLRRYCCHFLQAMFEGGDAHAEGFSEQELLPVHLGLEWWGEMKRAMAPTQQARVEEAMRGYVMTQMPCARWRSEWAEWLAGNTSRRGAQPCTLEELVRLWRVASSSELVLLLIEYELEIELEEEGLADPLLRQLIEGAADHMNWLNCMFSFPKDVEKREALNFLTCLHLATGSSSLHQTLTQSRDILVAVERDCLRLATHLTTQSTVGGDVKQFAHAVCTALSSHWKWISTDSARYPHTVV